MFIKLHFIKITRDVETGKWFPLPFSPSPVPCRMAAAAEGPAGVSSVLSGALGCAHQTQREAYGMEPDTWRGQE